MRAAWWLAGELGEGSLELLVDVAAGAFCSPAPRTNMKKARRIHRLNHRQDGLMNRFHWIQTFGVKLEMKNGIRVLRNGRAPAGFA